jgi:hypothetical protein
MKTLYITNSLMPCFIENKANCSNDTAKARETDSEYSIW